MALADITEKIVADSKQEASRIIADAEIRAGEIKKEAEEKEKAIRERFVKNVPEKQARETRKALTVAQSRARAELQKEKRNLVEEVFSKAIEEIKTLPSTQYEELIAQACSGISGDMEAVVYAPKGKKKEIENALKKAGLSFVVNEDAHVSSGCRIVSANAEYDLTFERMIADKREEMEIMVANILFED